MPKGTPSGDRIVWDDATERHLLILILLDSNPTVNWSSIAEKFGDKATPSALQQKYTKIRKRDAELFGIIDKDGTTSTPKKGSGLGGDATPKSTGTRKRSKKDYLAGLDDEEVETPKPKKPRQPKSKVTVKKEPSVDPGSVYADSEATTTNLDADNAEVNMDDNAVDDEADEEV